MILLDTQVALWWLDDDPRLGVEAREAIASSDVAYVSVVSAWEVAIKVSLGKLRIGAPFEAAVEGSGFSKLPLAFAHAAALVGLPSHHRDPFDRMLIVQARHEGLTFVTADRKMGAYEVALLWA